MKKQITQNTKAVILALILVLGVGYASAYSPWNPPTAAPPANNPDAPLNVSSAAQNKLGRLVLGTTSAAFSWSPYKLEVYGGPTYIQALSAGMFYTPGTLTADGIVTAMGIQIGQVDQGYYGDATNLAARVSNSGAFYVQNAAGAATWARIGKDYNNPSTPPFADFFIPVRATAGLIIHTCATGACPGDSGQPAATGQMWLVSP